jgi:hypothetical protein
VKLRALLLDKTISFITNLENLSQKILLVLPSFQNALESVSILSYLFSLVQRYTFFVHHLLDHPTSGSSLSNVAIPNGLNIVMNEVITTVSFFLRLITYNKMVFNEHYDRILSQLQS